MLMHRPQTPQPGFWFSYIITKIHPPFQIPGSAPEVHNPPGLLTDYSTNADYRLVINEGYGAQVTTIGGTNVVKRFCSNAVLLRQFPLRDEQNTREQLTRGGRSNRK